MKTHILNSCTKQNVFAVIECTIVYNFSTVFGYIPRNPALSRHWMIDGLCQTAPTGCFCLDFFSGGQYVNVFRTSDASKNKSTCQCVISILGCIRLTLAETHLSWDKEKTKKICIVGSRWKGLLCARIYFYFSELGMEKMEICVTYKKTYLWL